MLRGDLVTTSLPEVLRSLAESVATGCLRVTPDTDEVRPEDACVYLRNGRVYAVTLPGRAPRLGARLVASGDLAPVDLAEATEAQRTELQGWRLGELLVHLGYVERPVVEAFVAQQLREGAAELLHRTTGRWRFRASERTREDVVTPVPVDELLAEVAERRAAFEALAPVLHGADGVPVLSAADTAPQSQSLDPQAWSLLCSIDGERTVAELAAAGGFTLYEAGHLVAALVEAGLVEVEPPPAPVEEPVVDETVVEEPVVDEPVLDEPVLDEPVLDETEIAETVVDEPVAEPAGIAARLAAALKSLDPDGVGMVPTLMPGELADRSLERRVDDEVREDSVDRASATLASALGEATGELDLFPVDTTPRLAAVVPLDAKQAERRARDAQELAERQAELEATRHAEVEAAEAVAADDAAAAEATAAEAAVSEALAARAAADEAASQAMAESRRSAELQAAAFAELSASASLESAPVPSAEPVAERAGVAPEPAPRSVDEDPQPLPRNADTAALLRELSSLGLEEDPPPAAVPPPAAPRRSPSRPRSARACSAAEALSR